MASSLAISERVNIYITKGRPDAYCDACIAIALDHSPLREVELVTATLATTQDFNRSIRECDICSNVSPAIARLQIPKQPA